MLTFDSPTPRYYEHGIDRGVLYGSKPLTPPKVLSTNYIPNPAPGAATTGWSVYSGVSTAYATLSSILGSDGKRSIKAYRNTAGYPVYAQTFESTTDNWNKNHADQLTPALSTEQSFDGNSLKLGAGTSTNQAVAFKSVAASLAANTTYIAFVRMWIPSTNTGNAGAYMSGTGVNANTQTNTADRDKWTTVKHTFTTTATPSNGANIIIAAGGLNPIYVDAVYVAVSTLSIANLGMLTNLTTARPAGTRVTYQFEAKVPVGSQINLIRALVRDSPNNDSILVTPTSWKAGNFPAPPAGGALAATVTTQWQRYWVTFVVPDGRNATAVYAYGTTAAGDVPLGEHIYIRRVKVADGDLTDYHDGNTDDTAGVTYAWSSTADNSASTMTQILPTPVVWNGITGFDEGGEPGASTILYRDGIVYYADVDASDFKGHLKALFYPDEFADYIGIPMAADGLFVDNQKPKRFGFSYRSLVGSGMENDRFGYQIHLIYNAMASIGVRARKTLGSDSSMVDFDFDVVATPVKLPGYRPSAHYILDTRFMSQETVDQLEAILYGTESVPGMLPAPEILYDLLSFGDSITVIDHGDGTMTIRGSHDNVHETDYATAQINNINAVTNAAGDITISDGGSTTITTG